MGEIEKSRAGFWELSLIGQFRAIDRAKARLFAQAVADRALELGLNDCGWDIRQMSGEVLTDDQARMQLLNDTWRPEWGPKPWEQEDKDLVSPDLFPESVPHHEVQKALKDHKWRQLGEGDGKSSSDS